MFYHLFSNALIEPPSKQNQETRDSSYQGESQFRVIFEIHNDGSEIKVFIQTGIRKHQGKNGIASTNSYLMHVWIKSLGNLWDSFGSSSSVSLSTRASRRADSAAETTSSDSEVKHLNKRDTTCGRKLPTWDLFCASKNCDGNFRMMLLNK